eukprot:scaffold494_cov117-Isochrysis_galbana.AAC.18
MQTGRQKTDREVRSQTRDTDTSTLQPTPPIPVSHPHAGLPHPRTTPARPAHHSLTLTLTLILTRINLPPSTPPRFFLSVARPV